MDEPSAPKAQGGCQAKVTASMGPIMPIGTNTVTIHAYVDHQIVETIFNNRTAMVTYSAPPDETHTAVSLFGVGAAVSGTIETWELEAANNFGPQP